MTALTWFLAGAAGVLILIFLRERFAGFSAQ